MTVDFGTWREPGQERSGQRGDKCVWTDVPQPLLKHHDMGQKRQWDDVSSPGLLQRCDEPASVSDAQGDQNGILRELTVG